MVVWATTASGTNGVATRATSVSAISADTSRHLDIIASVPVSCRPQNGGAPLLASPPLLTNGGANSLSSGSLSAQMGLKGGRVKMRILVDRTTVEVFGNDGEIVIPACFIPPDDNTALELFTTGGTARVIALDVYPMRTAWRTA